MKLVINIPCFNEEKTLPLVLKELPKKIEGIDEIEVQIVDDGSKDKTIEVAKKFGCKVIKHRYNKGVGEAFKTGVDEFLKSKGDIFVNIDADNQFNPKDIPRLIKPILENKADVVSASRFSGIKPVNMPFHKQILNKMIASFVGYFLKYKIKDLTCGYRAYGKESLFKIHSLDKFTYTQESLISAINHQLKVVFVPVKVKYFKERKSRVVNSVFSYINKSALIILRTVRDTVPLKFFGIPSLVVGGVGILCGVIFTTLYLLTQRTTQYRTWFFLCIFLTIVGLLMFIFALMSDQMKNTRKMVELQIEMMKKERYDKK
ncbi:MAG: glycosyltransferase family 2 protein [Candidatus Woesearchaeota archaeon]